MLTRDGLAQAPSSAGTVDTQATRDALILSHLPQVRLIAKQINDRLPVSVGMEDLVSAGILGLIAAIDRFDPQQRVKLRTFAEYKIKGAMLDSLRTMDWAPRQHRRRGRLIEKTVAILEQKLLRKPTIAEVAAELSIPVEQCQEWLSAVSLLRLGSLEAMGEEREQNLLQGLEDLNGSSPSKLAEQAELRRLVAEIIERLPPLEKIVLNLYFHEELTLREIARIVDLHESRISQLKSRALGRIRSAMGSAVSLACLRQEQA